MSGTNKLNFTILHDTKVHLTTGNGFSSESNYGANNVLIDERASSIFIEKKVPYNSDVGNFWYFDSERRFGITINQFI